MITVSPTCGGNAVLAVWVTVTVVPDWVRPFGAAAIVRFPQMLLAGPGVLPFEQLPRLVVVNSPRDGPATRRPEDRIRASCTSGVVVVGALTTVNVPL